MHCNLAPNTWCITRTQVAYDVSAWHTEVCETRWTRDERCAEHEM